MSGSVTFRGVGVSGGIAVAPVFLLPDLSALKRSVGDPSSEALDLKGALERAAAALEELMEGLEEEAAAILEFQVLLLEDEEILDPIFESITKGQAADLAWRGKMDEEIADYASSDDEVFAARASDLSDLRDRVLRALSGSDESALPEAPSIFLAKDIPPSRFLEIDSAIIAGIALGEGSRTSHVSLLARAKGLPLVVGLGDLPKQVPTDAAILDPEAGLFVMAPSPNELQEAQTRAAEVMAERRQSDNLAKSPAVTVDGERVAVFINADHPSLLEGVDPDICDGIGLTRTEFLFQEGAPSEEEQYQVYSQILDWAAGRPVTIRTLDAGGDKPIPGLTQDGEANPFLGVRGVRLSLSRPEVLKTQLRALLRSAVSGPLKIMVPMVTTPSELEEVRALMVEAAAELEGDSLPFARPPLGMMIEVPAAALSAELFDADFYSIGTNDLIQYATACARDNGALAKLARGDHPGVLRLIESVVEAGRARGVEVSVCGDMASEPLEAELLLGAGIRSLSVAPAEVGRIKSAVAHFPSESVS